MARLILEIYLTNKSNRMFNIKNKNWTEKSNKEFSKHNGIDANIILCNYIEAILVNGM